MLGKAGRRSPRLATAVPAPLPACWVRLGPSLGLVLPAGLAAADYPPQFQATGLGSREPKTSFLRLGQGSVANSWSAPTDAGERRGERV